MENRINTRAALNYNGLPAWSALYSINGGEKIVHASGLTLAQAQAICDTLRRDFARHGSI